MKKNSKNPISIESTINPLWSGNSQKPQEGKGGILNQLAATIFNPLWLGKKPLEEEELRALNRHLFETVIGPDPDESEFNESEAVKKVYDLLEQGADANYGTTEPILTTAIKYRRPLIAAILMGNGANVNALDINGTSALTIAAEYNSVEMTALLLHAGAGTEICNDGKLRFTAPDPNPIFCTKEIISMFQKRRNAPSSIANSTTATNNKIVAEPLKNDGIAKTTNSH